MQQQPKDPKRSLRNKYRRRLHALSRAVAEVDTFGNERLKMSGIRDREETEKLLAGLEAIKYLLPKPVSENLEIDARVANNLALFFGISPKQDTPTAD